MTPPDLHECRRRLARYEGLLSRLCDALGISPDMARRVPGDALCEALERWVVERKRVGSAESF